MSIRRAVGCVLSLSCSAVFACAASTHSVEAPSSGSANASEGPTVAGVSPERSGPAEQGSAAPESDSRGPRHGAPLDDAAFPTACERAGDLCLPPRAFV
ncbi:MAG TPA: hypothetical protein VG963_13675, partial [Polyangiaceae bacterium]|nr:hypothetical protein [Polyangiaceae bacterium]